MTQPRQAILAGLIRKYDGHTMKNLFPSRPAFKFPMDEHFPLHIDHILTPAGGPPPSNTFEDAYPYANLAQLRIDDTADGLVGKLWDELRWYLDEFRAVLNEEDLITKLEFHSSIVQGMVGKPFHDIRELVDATRAQNDELILTISYLSDAVDAARDGVHAHRARRVDEYGGRLPRFNVMSALIEDVILHELAQCSKRIRTIFSDNKHNIQPAAVRIVELENQFANLKKKFSSAEETKGIDDLLKSSDDNHILVQMLHDMQHNLHLLNMELAEWNSPDSRLANPVGFAASDWSSQSMEDVPQSHSHPELPADSDDDDKFEGTDIH